MDPRPKTTTRRLQPWLWLALGGLVHGAIEAAWVSHAGARALLPGDALPAAVRIVGWSCMAPLTAAVAGLLLALGVRWWNGPEPSRLVDRASRMAVPAGWALLALAEPLARWPLPRGEDGQLVLACLVAMVALVASVRAWVGPAAALVGLAMLPLRVEPPGLRPDVEPTADTRVLALVTLDTFRADHLGSIGGWSREIHTPHLDGLAGSGALFLRGVSEVPLTLPSHVSMLTGIEPDALGVVRNGLHLGADAHTVAAELGSAGWTCGAFVSAGVLGSQSGLGRDFDHYDDRFDTANTVKLGAVPAVLARAGWLAGGRSQRRGDATLERTLRWLDTQTGPVFLWLHLYDPHAPYAPPAPYDTLYDPSAADAPGLLSPSGKRRGGLPFRQPRDVRRQVAAYDGEISWTDEIVGRLLAALPADAAIVVAGDHGESLVEHDYILNHGASLHEPSLHVPMLVRAPGVAAGARVEAPTSVRRVADTLRALGGLQPTGPSLLDAIDQQAAADTVGSPDNGDVATGSPDLIRSFAPGQQARPNFGQRPMRQVATRVGAEKWIVNLGGEVQRFDLDADPGELTDLSETDPRTPQVRAEGKAWLKQLGEVEANAKLDTSAATLEALEALGYFD